MVLATFTGSAEQALTLFRKCHRQTRSSTIPSTSTSFACRSTKLINFFLALCNRRTQQPNQQVTMNSGTGIQELMAAETRASQIVAEARIGEYDTLFGVSADGFEKFPSLHRCR
jgi:hypothetical protein